MKSANCWLIKINYKATLFALAVYCAIFANCKKTKNMDRMIFNYKAILLITSFSCCFSERTLNYWQYSFEPKNACEVCNKFPWICNFYWNLFQNPDILESRGISKDCSESLMALNCAFDKAFNKIENMSKVEYLEDNQWILQC